MISTITSGTMLNMYKYGSPTKQIDQKQVFANVSIMVGGDGSSISKAQLKSYIDKASNGMVKVSRQQLQAMKSMYSQWDNTFGKDRDTISFEDFNKAAHLFYQIAMTSNEEDENERFSRQMREKAEAKMKELTEKITGDKEKTPTLEQIQEYLKKLIENNENDKNSEEIAYVINLMEDIKNPKSEFKV